MMLTTCSLSIGELRSSNSTSRKHSQAQIKKAKHLFAKQGIIVPIIVDEHRHIIDGHLRYAAAQELAIENLNVVVVSDASPADLIELELSLNRLAEDSNWDEERLKQKLELLIEFKIDLSFTGFEQAEIDKVLSFEIIDEVEQDWSARELVTQVGDIWEVGEHIIACTDALFPQLEGEGLSDIPLAKVCVTDPPYNVPTQGHIRTSGSHEAFAMAAGEMSDDEFEGFLTSFLRAAMPFIADTALFYVCMDWRHIDHLNAATKAQGLIAQNLCVWSKTNAGMGSFYRSQHELIGVYSRAKKFQNNINLGASGRYRTNVWHYDGVTSFGPTRKDDLADHPTVKPVKLIADILLDCTSVGDWVLDPFLGSGTTCLAAEQVNRRCLGFELEPKFVEVALRRLKDRCGLEAVHVQSGKSYDEIRDDRLKNEGDRS
jgi:DNA modification methylase